MTHIYPELLSSSHDYSHDLSLKTRNRWLRVLHILMHRSANISCEQHEMDFATMSGWPVVTGGVIWSVEIVFEDPEDDPTQIVTLSARLPGRWSLRLRNAYSDAFEFVVRNDEHCAPSLSVHGTGCFKCTIRDIDRWLMALKRSAA